MRALAKELFKGQQEYISKVATNAKETCVLVDAGFEYVTGEYADGGKIFRTPKCTRNGFNVTRLNPPRVFPYLVRGVGFEPTKACAMGT